MHFPEIPPRRLGRSRDRHGRGLRGPLLPPYLPGWRSRSAQFDDLVVTLARRIVRANPALRGVQFGVEEVPPSDPSPWEHDVALGRTFPADRSTASPARIVVYRQPLLARSEEGAELRTLLHHVLLEQAGGVLGTTPADPGI